MHQVLLPADWPRPKGYANGVSARGRTVFVAGMIGWDKDGAFHSDDLVAQTRQALEHIVAVLAVDQAEPQHITRMTWYVTSRAEYLARSREIGQVYREIIGNFNVAMSAVEVSALMEARAQVEIEVTAVVPE